MFKKFPLIFLCVLLFYTRFVGLDWGLPYPMHPDERNMAVAVQQLTCKGLGPIAYLQPLTECLNPHFFAYGQFPIYLAYFGILIFHFLQGIKAPPGFIEATMALRTISALASVANAFVLFRIIEFSILDFQFSNKSHSKNSKNKKLNENWLLKIGSFLVLIFSPYFIQFSHFGTTESLLMLFYSFIIYECIKLIQNKNLNTNYYLLATISGIAIATKVSSVLFLAVPVVFIGIKTGLRSLTVLFTLSRFILLTMLVSIIFSPHNIISLEEFAGSMNYESAVAIGSYVAFYTKQFVNAPPLIFQLTKIFPFVLGWPQFILSVLGLLVLSWRDKRINVLRFAFIVFFLPNAFVFAKWTRFMTPIFPILSLFTILTLCKLLKVFQNKFSIINDQFSIIYRKLKIERWRCIENWKLKIDHSIVFILITIVILPGIAYLSIYQTPDVRFRASKWIYKYISPGSKILSETANVIDIPIPPPNYHPPIANYQIVSFDFYNLDQNPTLPPQLNQFVKTADYIFIPSRRIFANHPKLQYPLLNKYYQDLYSGGLGYEKVAEFTSYPKISLFGKTILELPDEGAEETWSVFDHPVIRIYKKVSNSKLQITNDKQITNNKIQNPQLDFSNYQTTNYQLQTTNYHLLIADTPQKWEKGLMYVQNREDIGGYDGMIFMFPDSKKRSFWNKNTFIDLDIYWMNDDKIAGTTMLPSIEKSKDTIITTSSSEVNAVIEIIQ